MNRQASTVAAEGFTQQSAYKVASSNPRPAAPIKERSRAPRITRPVGSRRKAAMRALKSRVFPRVSVIIPCYNSAKTIADTLASVSAQTFSDYEVVLVND